MRDKGQRYIDIFLKKSKGHRYKVILSVLSGIIRSVLMLLPTMMIQEIINGVSNKISIVEISLKGILYVAFPAIVLVLYVADTRLSKFVFDIIRDIRLDAINNLIHQPISWVRKNSDQVLYNKVILSTLKISEFYFSSLSNTIWYTSTIIAGCILMLRIDLFISIILIAISIIQLVVLAFRKKYVKSIENEINEVDIEGNSIVSECIEFNSYIKLLGLSDNIWERNRRWNANYKKTVWLQIKNNLFSNTTASLCELLRIICLLFFSQIAFVSGEIKVGDIYALNSYITWLTPVFFGLQRWIVSSFMVKNNQERVEDVLLLESKKEIKTLTCEEIRMLSFSDVYFSYDSEEKAVINHLSFRIPNDNILFIMGPSGSGKSTIANLLLKLEKPDSGRITINDEMIDQYSDAWFALNVIGATQGTDLIETSLRENLNYSGSAYSDEEIYEVLKSLDMLDRVNRLEDGLDTVVSREVVNFSEGERKRLGITRVLLSKAHIMVYDEPTAGLDNVIKLRVMDVIRQKAKNKIVIIITHDHSILKDKDIVVNIGENTL